jgi:hypothetical protein
MAPKRGPGCTSEENPAVRPLTASILFIAMTVAGVHAQPTPVADRAYMLIGTWHCHSGAGTDSKLTFVQNGDGSLTATNELYSGDYAAVITAGGATRTFTERYVFDSQRQLWTNTDAWNGLYEFGFVGTANPWTSDQWQITGRVHTSRSPGAGAPERKTYTYIGPNEFQRRITTVGPGLSDSVCKRVDPMAPKATPS